MKGKLMQQLIKDLNADLSNEYKHMFFYLYHSAFVRGHDALALADLFADFANSEAKHVRQFLDVIVSLGGTPTTKVNDFATCKSGKDACRCAHDMENEVVANFVDRIQQVDDLVQQGTLSPGDAIFLTGFLEEQIAESKGDKAVIFAKMM